MAFANLHTHTAYSLLDSISRPEDIVKKVKETGQCAVCISDHGNTYASVKTYKLAKKEGLKYIYAAEMYITQDATIKDYNNRYNHLIVIAKNEQGRINLNRLISLSNKKNHFYYKPRIDKKMLEEHSEGLIISSACMAGSIMRKLAKGDIDGAESDVLWYKSIFGDDYYLEIQSHRDEEQFKLNRMIIDMAKRLDVKYIVTADAHYINEEDKELHSVFVQIGQARETGETYNDCFLQSEEDVRRILGQSDLTQEEIDTAIANTVEIVGKCDVKIPLSAPIIPHVEVPKEFSSEEEYLKHLCNKGWVEKGINKLSREEREKYKERLLYEFETSKEMNFLGYYLLVHSYISVAIDRSLGRGSSGGSLIAFLLSITDVDPIKFGLYYERFIDVGQIDLLKQGIISPEEIKIPDIDTDFTSEDRERVFNFIKSTYGEDRVASIGSFNYLWNKSTIKDVARVLGVPYDVANAITKYFDDLGIDKDEPLDDVIIEYPVFKKYQDEYPKLFDYAKRLIGLPRSSSIHPSGVVIYVQDATFYTPITESDDGRPVMEIDMKDAELLGLVKVDLLGLKDLSVLHNTLRMIGQPYSYVSPQTIDLNDEKIYKEVFQSENCNLIPQFSSQGMQSSLKKLIPTTIQDLSAINSMYRPGPMQYMDTYINRKHGLERIEYINDDLADILDWTYGIMTYQEEIIEIGKLAGMRNSDRLRVATAKKKKEVMDEVEPELRSGLYKRGWTQEQVDKLWDDMLKYSKYSFNKAHSTEYALFAYMCAKLKVYHPVEYICASFNANEGKHDEMESCFKEARRLSVQFYSPSWRNTSSLCKVIDGKILYGTSLIKFCNRQISDDLQKLSQNKYDTFTDFLKDLREQTTLNSRQIGILINLNYFSEFGNNKKLFQIYEKFEDRFKVTHKDKTKLQRIAEIKEYELLLPNDTYKPQEQVKLEQEYYGFIVTTYPNIKPSYVMAIEINTKYTPVVKFYQFNTGNEMTCKVRKNLYMNERGKPNFEVGDIINVKKSSYRNKRKLINDQWTETDEQELYIDDFILVKPTNKENGQ